MRLTLSNLHRCRDGRISKPRRYARVQTRLKPTNYRPKSLAKNVFENSHLAYRDYSSNAMTESSMFLSSLYSPESQPIISSLLMLDGSSLGPTTIKYDSLESYEGRRRPVTSSGVECAVCGSALEIMDRLEWFLPFFCRHVAHERCFYEYIKEQESRACPICNVPLAVNLNRVNRRDIGKRPRFMQYDNISCLGSHLSDNWNSYRRNISKHRTIPTRSRSTTSSE